MCGVAHPALAARKALIRAVPGGMLKWDTSGRALLVSDAPRRGQEAALRAAANRHGLCVEAATSGLLYVDFSAQRYAALLDVQAPHPGAWSARWFALQALLGGIWGRAGVVRRSGWADTSLLRQALLATVRGEGDALLFAQRLREADAIALRSGDASGSVAAAAALLADWLWRFSRVGVPLIASVDGWRMD